MVAAFSYLGERAWLCWGNYYEEPEFEATGTEDRGQRQREFRLILSTIELLDQALPEVRPAPGIITNIRSNYHLQF